MTLEDWIVEGALVVYPTICNFGCPELWRGHTRNA